MNPKKMENNETELPSKQNPREFESINKIIHQPIRLQILSLLLVVEQVDMLFLKQQLGISWGNLSTHISKLEDAEYLTMTKKIVEKRTYSTLKITELGKKEFEIYRSRMKSMLNFS